MPHKQPDNHYGRFGGRTPYFVHNEYQKMVLTVRKLSGCFVKKLVLVRH